MRSVGERAARMAWSRRAKAVAWILCLIGMVLRVREYLGGRALWRDEASLALNLVHRSFAQLLQPLDHDQGAPVGFLWACKLATTLFGYGEYALRLVPLLAGKKASGPVATYICRNFTCAAPIVGVEELRKRV